MKTEQSGTMSLLCIHGNHSSRRSARAVVLALLLGASVTSAGVVLGDEPRLSRDQAIEQVREHTDGRILGVDTRNEDYFRIRVLVREGEVRVYEVDRRSGAVRH
ncbi:hypothetical protein HC341_03100 [Aquisalimonas sp. 2447]|uniref:PepSY domain-containing protein n=1 Tax=Aquisalimonas sp. 2447 TaxID=2740807 RepID=UPI0014324D44|nr:hypothetical protein [Aquisalimonas sp. 2447]QIT54294.1 hypothetical protein HC341_03100 [Aquisalimonas sp. 2447]